MKQHTHEIYAFGKRCLRRRVGLALLALGLAALAPFALSVSVQAAPDGSIAVLPFEINDTSGEVGQTRRHEMMLATITRLVGEKIAQKGIYHVVPQETVDTAVAEVDSGTYLRSCNGCEFDVAKRAGADHVLIGWFYKVSTLIGTLHIVVKDVATGKTVYAHVFDFRGDNEKAWSRAVTYMIGSLAKKTVIEKQETN